MAGTQGGPALNEVLSCGAAPGSYSSQWIVLSSGICSISSMFCFNDGGGLSYPNPSYITNQYTIHLFCRFSSSAPRIRVLDFSNGTINPGIYIQSNCLNIAPAGNTGPCPSILVPNQFYLLSFVRNASTNALSVYVDGSLFGTYNDASCQYCLPTNTTPIVFFRDDNAVPCETEGGCIKYAAVTSAAMSAVDIATTWFNLCAKILPLDLTAFDAKAEDDKVLLNWKTGNDNTVLYEIERATDAEHFSKIGQATAPGSGEKGDFTFYDNFPETGINYYRLKQTDKSGKQSYSPLTQASYEKKKPAFYPNPSGDAVFLNADCRGKDVSIKNILGESFPAKADEHGKINTSALEDGIYILSIDNTAYRFVVKR